MQTVGRTRTHFLIRAWTTFVVLAIAVFIVVTFFKGVRVVPPAVLMAIEAVRNNDYQIMSIQDHSQQLFELESRE